VKITDQRRLTAAACRQRCTILDFLPPCLPQATLLTRNLGLLAEVRSLEADQGATATDTLLFQLAAAEEHCASAGARDVAQADLKGEAGSGF
jgi:hypothetical protein